MSELQDVCEIIQIVHAKALHNLAVYEDCLCAMVDICNRVSVARDEWMSNVCGAAMALTIAAYNSR